MLLSLAWGIFFMPLRLWIYFLRYIYVVTEKIICNVFEKPRHPSVAEGTHCDPTVEEIILNEPEASDSFETPAVLENTLILRKILTHLSSRDLLVASEVNKTWNREARSLLRDQRECLMSIYGERPCVMLLRAAKEFYENHDGILPFNGILFDFDLSIPHQDCLEHRQEVETQLELLLESFPTKFLRVRSICKNSPYRCITVEFVYKMMLRNAETIEEMDFEQCPDWLAYRFMDPEPDDDEETDDEEDTEPVGRQIFLPALKKLNLTIKKLLMHWHQDFYPPEISRRNFVSKIVRGAPNLESIGPEWDLRDLTTIPRRAWPLVQHLKIGHDGDYRDYGDGQWRFLEVAAEIPWKSNLQTLSIHSYAADTLLSRNFRLLPSLVTGSFESLTRVKFPYCILKMMAEDGIPALKNVTYMNLELHLDDWDRMKLPVFPWKQYFPQLTSMEIMVAEDSAEFCTCHDDLENQDSHYVCTTLRNLVLITAGIRLNYENFKEFTDSFPNVRVLTWRTEELDSIPECLPCMWGSCVNLAYLNLCLGNHITFPTNSEERKAMRIKFTEAFTGISAIEIAQLLEENDEFLGLVNLVPSGPAISNLKDLMTLGVLIRDTEQYTEEDCLIRTRLADMISFDRMEHLRVIIYR